MDMELKRAPRLLRFSEFCETLERDQNRPNKKRSHKKYRRTRVAASISSNYPDRHRLGERNIDLSLHPPIEVIPET
jgi:hypothetical protein